MSIFRVSHTLWSDSSIKTIVTDSGSLYKKFFWELQSLFRAAFAASHFNKVSHPAASPSRREVLLPGLDQRVGRVTLAEAHPATAQHSSPLPQVLKNLKPSLLTWWTFLLDTLSSPPSQPQRAGFHFHTASALPDSPSYQKWWTPASNVLRMVFPACQTAGSIRNLVRKAFLRTLLG